MKKFNVINLGAAFFSRLRSQRKWQIGAAIIVVAAVAIGFFSFRKKDGVKLNLSALVPDETVVARTGDIRRTVSATGRIVPNREVAIKCKASGQIIELPFDISDTVKVGDILVKLDPIDEERSMMQAKLNLQIAENNLSAAKAAMESAEIDHDHKKIVHQRNVQLFEKKLLSQEAFDNSQLADRQAVLTLRNKEIAVADAGANLEAKKIALSDAEQRLLDTTVKSPSNGVINALNVQIGQIVSSGTNNVGGGTEIMTISDVEKMFAEVEVDESEIAEIVPGLPVEVAAESRPDRKFSGTVQLVYARGTRNRGVVNFRVRIEIANPDLQYLRSEMTANVEIILASAKDAVLLPSPAIRSDTDGSFVMVADENGKAEKRQVTTGIDNRRNVQITSGLAAGENVIISVSADEARWIRNALNRNVMTEWATGRVARPQRK